MSAKARHPKNSRKQSAPTINATLCVFEVSHGRQGASRLCDSRPNRPSSKEEETPIRAPSPDFPIRGSECVTTTSVPLSHPGVH